MRLYAHAPTAITVDTNPTGLQVIVDGTTCTAPCVFTNWTSGSQHTLSVPSANQTLQTLNSQNYIFGRWNAVMTGNIAEQTVTVTNSLGNGTLLSPSTAPAITNYLASFIPIHPYNPVIYPSGDGTIASSPLPSSIMIDGTPTNYFIDRQLVTITVNPTAAGYSFYDWYQVSLFNYYTNPFTFYITTNFDYYNFDTSDPVTAVLVPDPVTTIAAASPDITSAGLGIFPGFAIGVTDGNGNAFTAYTPENFDAIYDLSGFAAGKNLAFSTAGTAFTTQSPVTTNISYQFGTWTGAGTPNGSNLSVTVPASGVSTSTANFTPSFRSLVSTYLSCPDVSGNNELNVTSTPGGTNVDPYDTKDGDLDAFFTSGNVSFTAGTGTSGLSLAGWSLDLAAGGISNPYSYLLTGQTLGTANFNIPGAAPLTITSVSPVTVASGTVYITVTGTGFSTNAANLYTYYVDPVNGYWMYRPNTPPAGSSTQTVVQLNPGDVATAGYYQIVVLNAVTSGCNPSIVFTFPVANSAGPPVLGITKTNVGNFNQGQQNAQYTILVSNIGTGPTVDPVTVTEAVPSGETLVSMSGSGWNCSVSPTCTQTSALVAGMSYGAITVTVNVAANASSPQVNTATVSGGGAASATASDSTTIIVPVSVPNVVGDTQAVATTAITGASLVVGTVTMAYSATVASGNVISESPVAGTVVSSESAVNLVVSKGPGTAGVVSVTPNPATGVSNTFALKYSDTAGHASLNHVGVIFNPGTLTSNSCYVLYYPAANLLYLYNTAGTATTKITPGSGTLSNSQCTISGSGTTVVKSGIYLTLNLAVTASSTYTGKQTIFMYAEDASLSNTGWVDKGTWTPAANQPPTVVSVTPTSATGRTNTFALTYSDPNGASDLDVVEVDFGSTVSASSSCFVLYYPATNSIELLTNMGGASSKIAPGSGTLSNGQCTVSGSGTTVVWSGDTITLHLKVTASAAYTGVKNIYLFAEDNSAAKTTYVKKGTWTP